VLAGGFIGTDLDAVGDGAAGATYGAEVVPCAEPGAWYEVEVVTAAAAADAVEEPEPATGAAYEYGAELGAADVDAAALVDELEPPAGAPYWYGSE
jgi:hypothetical protein